MPVPSTQMPISYFRDPEIHIQPGSSYFTTFYNSSDISAVDGQQGHGKGKWVYATLNRDFPNTANRAVIAGTMHKLYWPTIKNIPPKPEDGELADPGSSLKGIFCAAPNPPFTTTSDS